MTPSDKFGPKSDTDYVSRAVKCWGGEPPDWVLALARAADAASSQVDLGRRIDIPASSISAVLGNSYPGGTRMIEQRVRGALMNAQVDCPVLGGIRRNLCLDHQKQPFSAASPTRAQLYRACRKPCINYIGGKPS